MLTLDEKFHLYHARNPQVYAMLVKFARQAKQAGAFRLGIKMLWERLRWENLIEAQGTATFKLPNSYTSRYARLIMTQEKDLDGFFETRKLRT